MGQPPPRYWPEGCRVQGDIHPVTDEVAEQGSSVFMLGVRQHPLGLALVSSLAGLRVHRYITLVRRSDIAEAGRESPWKSTSGNIHLSAAWRMQRETRLHETKPGVVDDSEAFPGLSSALQKPLLLSSSEQSKPWLRDECSEQRPGDDECHWCIGEGPRLRPPAEGLSNQTSAERRNEDRKSAVVDPGGQRGGTVSLSGFGRIGAGNWWNLLPQWLYDWEWGPVRPSLALILQIRYGFWKLAYIDVTLKSPEKAG
ncbi:hypothetical protein GLOTRDRAFT_89749 [Gloeophyllum trabeum ATCC 11539]|uniref:Uncharacterized protein n=1 Tax=Gloeophyllum trabeum (strain ATCC 11539 / FP-39264 / Madison 617) TaxID=670483 RepID=S7QK87_GLOTA|nr:uncharacterized protein GLOTRDRAFT_89749 [Gloeophyllum trabeum ATCC 11539]EPQ60161.1 hypothetical protein GLOTRDRAFT_89749 [Gloeophyllum trabeum ATCC 11539]